MPYLGDPRYYKAVMLMKAGNYKEAAIELNAFDTFVWLDPSLKTQAQQELERIHLLGNQEQ